MEGKIEVGDVVRLTSDVQIKLTERRSKLPFRDAWVVCGLLKAGYVAAHPVSMGVVDCISLLPGQFEFDPFMTAAYKVSHGKQTV